VAYSAKVLLYGPINAVQATRQTETPAISTPRIIARADHNISRALVSENALKVLYRLRNAGYDAYLVGGCVRDLLLGREPKDFDVATNALPDQVREQFRNCRLIGRRFRLAHVHFGPEIVEVATFRGHHDTAEEGGGEMRDGMIVRDNVYGTLEEDAWRRDFTVNALYYNIEDFSVVDYTGGLDDLRAGLLRPIGEPLQRFREDPVRMLRAARFAAKLGFRIEANAEAAILELHTLLEHVPPARLFDEMQKLFMAGYAVETFELLRRYQLFKALFPETDALLGQQPDAFPRSLLIRGLENTDARVGEGKSVTPAFLFAVMLWDAVKSRIKVLMKNGTNEHDAYVIAANDVMQAQSEHVAIPKRFSTQSKEIWTLQHRLAQRQGRRPLRLMSHPRFRAAYDFLLLRVEAGEETADIGEWWTRFQAAGETERETMLEELPRGQRALRKRRRRRKRPGNGGSSGNSGGAAE
jgi:poly(A) polymerase